MLRILNGGVDASPLLDPERLAMVTGVRPEQYLDLAALRGDSSDNLPGVTGFGTKTAVRLLQAARHRRGGLRRRRQRRRAVPGGRRHRPHQGARRTRSQGAVAAQPRGDGDGHHRRARPRPGRLAPAGCRSTRTPSGRRTRRFELHVPPRSGRSPCASPPARSPSPTSTRAGRAAPRPQGRAAAAAGADAGGPGLRPGDALLRRLAGVTDQPRTPHRRRGRHLQPAGHAAAPARAAGRGARARRGARRRQRVDRRHRRMAAVDLDRLDQRDTGQDDPGDEHRRSGRLQPRAGVGDRARRRPGLADGRRRAARPGLPGHPARARGPRLLGAGRAGRPGPGPAVLPDPAAGRHHGRARDGRGRAGRHRRADPRTW